MKFIACPLFHSHIISPAVGTFYRSIPGILPYSCDNMTAFGIIQRLDEKLILTVPEHVLLGNFLCHDADFVMVGTPLASIEIQNHIDVLQKNAVKSPSDGFISTVDDSGSPFAVPEMRLKHGQIIAILELMKIRMDITFDGPDNAIFLRYLCPEKSAVKKNDVIFEYQI